MGRNSFLEDVVGAWEMMSTRKKFLMVVQSVLSVALILVLVLDYGMGFNRVFTNRIELSILIALWLVSAFRSYPERKKAIVLYLICMVIAVVCLVLNCVL